MLFRRAIQLSVSSKHWAEIAYGGLSQFCVDEKTAIQALDRLDPLLPLSPSRIERHGFEYYRHWTLSI